MSWRDEAACRDKPAAWFFPTDADRPHDAYRLGRQVCAACPVVAECAAEHRRAEAETGMALPGLWAGRTPADRRNARPRIRDRQAAPVTCAACGGTFRDSGRGSRPRFCSNACSQRAAYRRTLGSPEGDREFEEWRLSGAVGEGSGLALLREAD